MNESMTTSAAREALAEIVAKVSRQETRVVEENGMQLAAIISAGDLARLEQLDRQREDEWRVFDEIHSRNLDKDPEEVERDVADAIDEMRREERAKCTPLEAL